MISPGSSAGRATALYTQMKIAVGRGFKARSGLQYYNEEGGWVFCSELTHGIDVRITWLKDCRKAFIAILRGKNCGLWV